MTEVKEETWAIWVQVGSDIEIPVEMLNTTTVGAFFVMLIEKFKLKARPGELVVRAAAPATPEIGHWPKLGDHPRATLAEVLKGDQGKYQVYVELPLEKPWQVFDATLPVPMFWQRLSTVEIQNEGGLFDYLPLDSQYGPTNSIESLYFGNNTSNQLIVRGCYPALFDAIWTELGPGKVFITGTPGIGKTTFRNYVAWRILQRFKGQRVAIAMAKGDSPYMHVMCSSGTKFEVLRDVMPKDLSLLSYTLGETLFVLADISEGNSGILGEISRGLVAFTSPNVNSWKTSKERRVIFFMPLWTEEELLARQSSAPEVDFRERYIKYGGVARVVWGSSSTVEQCETDFLEPISDDTLKAMKTRTYAEVQHKFVYLKVPAVELKDGTRVYDFKSLPVLEMGSRYIARLVAKALVTARLDRTNSQIFAGAPPSVHALLFEAVALELLLNWSHTTRFEIARLLPEIDSHPTVPGAFSSRISKREFKFSPPTLVEFMNENDAVSAVKTALASHEVLLALPRSTNFAGFDGIYAWKESGVNYAFLLQATIGISHPLSNGGGEVLRDFVLNGFSCCIGYVTDGEIWLVSGSGS